MKTRYRRRVGGFTTTSTEPTTPFIPSISNYEAIFIKFADQFSAATIQPLVFVDICRARTILFLTYLFFRHRPTLGANILTILDLIANTKKTISKFSAFFINFTLFCRITNLYI